MASISSVNSDYSALKFDYGSKSVSFSVYPRLHMFSADLSLSSGILKHGSMGFSLMNLPITVRVALSDSLEDVIGGNVNIELLDYRVNLDSLRKHIGGTDYWNVTIEAAHGIFEHTGIGVSTQVSGAIFIACAKFSGFELKIDDLFRLGVGHYSTLGLNLLFNPGFLFEVGCRPVSDETAPVVNPQYSKLHELPVKYALKVSRFPFYTIVCIPAQKGIVYGQVEDDFWASIPPDSTAVAHEVVYEIYERIMPSIVEADFDTFIAAMKTVTAIGTKPIEESVQSDATKTALNNLRSIFGFAAVSSMGPTLYSFSATDPADKLKAVSENLYTIYSYAPEGL